MKEISFDCQLDLVKSGTNDRGAFHVTGYAATTDFDLQEDIISHEAMQESADDLLHNSTMLFNHDDSVPIGKIVKQQLDQKGILIDAIIDKTAVVPKTGAKVVDMIKQGILNKFSIRAKVLEAKQEFVAELDTVANVIKRMLLIECSLVSIPANPEAKAMNYYIGKALKESKEMTEEAKAKKEEAKKEEAKKSDGIQFPAMDQLVKDWQGYCADKGLTLDSEQADVHKGWTEFAAEKGLPDGFYYAPKSAGESRSLLGLCDRLIKGGLDGDVIKQVAEAIKSAVSKLIVDQTPYPATAEPKAPEEQPAKKSAEPSEDAKVIEGLMQQVASLSKKLDAALAPKKPEEKKPEEPVVRKGQGGTGNEGEISKTLDEAVKDENPEEALRHLYDVQGVQED
jgi:HK97 family phage prohead protease